MRILKLALLLFLAALVQTAGQDKRSKFALPYELLYFYYAYKLEYQSLDLSERRMATELSNTLGRMATFSEFVNFLLGNHPDAAPLLPNQPPPGSPVQANTPPNQALGNAASQPKAVALDPYFLQRVNDRLQQGQPGAKGSANNAPRGGGRPFLLGMTEINTVSPPVDGLAGQRYTRANGRPKIIVHRLNSDLPPVPKGATAEEIAEKWKNAHEAVQKTTIASYQKLNGPPPIWTNDAKTDVDQAKRALGAVIEMRVYDTNQKGFRQWIADEIFNKLPWVPRDTWPLSAAGKPMIPTLNLQQPITGLGLPGPDIPQIHRDVLAKMGSMSMLQEGEIFALSNTFGRTKQAKLHNNVIVSLRNDEATILRDCA